MSNYRDGQATKRKRENQYSNYVPAHEPGSSAKYDIVPMPMPERVERVPHSNGGIRVESVGASGQRDGVSAQDRAKGRLISNAPRYVAFVCLALGMMILYIYLGPAGALDSLMVFLFSLALITFAFEYMSERLWFQHSNAGVERHKVDVLAEIRRAEIEHEYRLRTEHLEVSRRMIEAQHERRLIEDQERGKG